MKVRWHASTHEWMASLSPYRLDSVVDHLKAVARDPMMPGGLGSLGSRSRYTRLLKKHIAFDFYPDFDIERGTVYVTMVKDAPAPKYVSRRKILPFKRR